MTTSFAVPFAEDEKTPAIFFLDHSYLENMYRMFRKVNAREKVIGWYHTGPRLRENDVEIHRLVSEFVDGVPSKTQAVLVICEVKPKDVGLPVHAYKAVDQVCVYGADDGVVWREVSPRCVDACDGRCG